MEPTCKGALLRVMLRNNQINIPCIFPKHEQDRKRFDDCYTSNVSIAGTINNTETSSSGMDVHVIAHSPDPSLDKRQRVLHRCPLHS